MKNRLKRILRKWLFPEYDEVCRFMLEVQAAKENIIHRGAELTFKEPVILLGSLSQCKVQIKPTLKPEIVLSKLTFQSLLEMSGHHQVVTSTVLSGSLPPGVGISMKEK